MATNPSHWVLLADYHKLLKALIYAIRLLRKGGANEKQMKRLDKVVRTQLEGEGHD